MTRILVQDYLRRGFGYDSLLAEHHVKAKPYNGKVSFLYEQFAARREDALANQCRGLILREGTWDVLAYPFDRFFDHDEPFAAAVDWSTAACEEKLDGTLCIVYWDEKERRWHVGTRSTPEAHLSVDGGEDPIRVMVYRAAGGSLEEYMAFQDRGITWMFELTGPDNRVVCQYGAPALTLIGARRLSDFQEIDPEPLARRAASARWRTPERWLVRDLPDLVARIADRSPLEVEGAVVKDAGFRRVKVKSPAWLAAHHAIDSLGASWRAVCEAIQSGHSESIWQTSPPRVQRRIERLRTELSLLAHRTEKDLDSLIGVVDMKEFAERAKHRLWPAALFAVRRGKAPDVTSFLMRANADTVLELCRKLGWSEEA